MMRIVATSSVMMTISAYVSYMKQAGYNRDNLIMQKDRMLSFLNGQIDRAISSNTNNQPMTHTCYWMDKYTPVTWYFTFYVLPQQNLVVVMQFYSKENGKSVNEGRQVIRLDKAGLKEMIAEMLIEKLKGLNTLKGYADSIHYGREYLEKQYDDIQVPKYEKERLLKSYDRYARKENAIGEYPNNTGFDLWRNQKEANANEKGIRLYPDYY